MSRKQDEEDEAAREQQRKADKRAAAREVVAPETTLVGGLPADAYLTEQEKNPTGDPVNPPVEPVPAEVLDIPTKQPYPTGSPPDPYLAIGREPPKEGA